MSNTIKLSGIEGDVYVVGDIHGRFDLLDQALDFIFFDKDKDLLIATGDLIDRGDRSVDVARYLSQSWFHSTLGNHEDFLLRHYENPDDEILRKMWVGVGGGWFGFITHEEQTNIYQLIKNLPLAITIEHNNRCFGVVHADVPSTLPWPLFCQLLDNNDEETIETALWSRSRVYGDVEGLVQGVDTVLVGHTPQALSGEVRPAGYIGNSNVICTDTSAYSVSLRTYDKNAALSLIRLDQTKMTVIEQRLISQATFSLQYI